MEQTINPPDLDDLLAESRQAVFANINCVQVGKLTKINDDQTCEIEIQFLRKLADGTTKKYTPLVDCPYFVLNGGGAYIDMPIQKGDYCLVLFNDRNIDDWWDTANVAVPPDTRKHSISDGIALVGINPRSKAFEFDGESFRILGPTGSDIVLKFHPDGTVSIEAKKLSFGDGTNEVLDLFDQLLTELQKSVDLTGVASTGTNSLINAALAAIQTKLGTIKV